ncbi:hypothetical protein [Streptomyces sp. NBC_01465]|uniref:hypothetical protein n=1 Tax=Streptomyces sp. NBC_01465 TaxID=2903878 RepID=UPI002E352FD4|nr:hypothetical protein [Streptomyces sp. NBC_01465]
MPHSDYRGEYRHEFRPGKLLAGLVLIGVSIAYLGDAGGAWNTPSEAAGPAVVAGLLVAGAVNWVAYRVRRRRTARIASSEKSGVPASTSGSQAIK